jgi:FKBP-type peptidyl-prolyl cis-trans isomerase
MKKRSIFGLLLAWAVVIACQQTEEPFAARKTKDNREDIFNYLTANKIKVDSTLSGLYYFVQNTNPIAQKPQIGDEISLSYVARRLDGVIVDSSQAAFPIVYIRAPEQGGSGYRFGPVPAIEELMQTGTEKLREGDKVSLFVPWTLRNSGGASLLAPLYIPLRYDIVVKKIRTEDEQIDEYIAFKKLTVTERQSNGLRFIRVKTLKDSTQIKFGEIVKVFYTGRLASNDRQFDPVATSLFPSSLSVTVADTATSNVGASVVKGFNDGIYRLKYGEKGIIIFPSKLGYSTTPKATIPAYSPLYFEIEVNR